MSQFCLNFALLQLRRIFQQGFSSVVILISFLGVFLGISIILIVVPIMDGFHQKFEEAILGFGGHVKIFLNSNEVWQDLERQDFLQQIQNFPEVDFIFPTLSLQALLMQGSSNFGVLAVGLDEQYITKQQFLQQYILKDIALDHFFNMDDFSIIIGKQLADKMSLSVGSSISLVSFFGNKTLIGNLPNVKKFIINGIFSSGFQEIDQNVIFLNLPIAQRFFGKANHINSIEIFLHDNHNTLPIINKIKQIHSNLQISDWQRENEQLFKTLQMESNIMLVLLFLIVVVSSFNIMTGMVMFVERKKNTVAILLTIGASRVEIMLIFLTIGLILGCLATLLGNFMAFLIVDYINQILLFLENFLHIKIINIASYQLDRIPHQFNVLKIIFINCLTFFLVFVSSLLPAWLATRKQPVDLLRRNE